ncbi:SDR family NAD(P)-dependent oxidoreductase [Paenibacillus sp. GCM10027626]|uniref:SDR family NAD(P)-dependent oxidoreductase n=1 Tax=Paenibacillus sp. GCM10027626 TaxID=3273411 RepID=UPI003632C0A2
MGSLKGKVAIVTGAGRGIGSDIARQLAAAGAKVVVNYANSEQGASSTVRVIEDAGHEAIAVRADISGMEGIERLVGRTIETYGRVDILVNNAAVDPTENFFDVTESFYEQVVNTNLKGTFFCTQACAKEMIRQGGGKVINISSIHGQLTMPRYAVYAATKGAINALTRQLALDLAPSRITVNAVAPGAVEVDKFIGQPWYDAEQFGSYIPAGRIGRPEDISPLVVFLASDAADYITGQVITADGGSSTKLFLPVDVR